MELVLDMLRQIFSLQLKIRQKSRPNFLRSGAGTE